jgi:hypothetical protein
MTTSTKTTQTKRFFVAHNSQGAFLGSFVAVSAKAAAQQMRRDWFVASGDAVTMSDNKGDSVTFRTRN